MWCVAICHDVEGGGAARTAHFQAHAVHNFAQMGAFLFTGPTATADGATGIGDDPRLRGSIYCLDVAGLAAARAVMEADPFNAEVWRQIDYYEWRDPAGVWLDGAPGPKGPAFGGYVAVSQTPLDVEGALAAGTLAPLASTGVVAAPLRAIALLHAANMEAATLKARGAEWVAAVPIAIGRWMGISSPADLPPAAAA